METPRTEAEWRRLVLRLERELQWRAEELKEQRELNRRQRETIARLEQRIADLEMRVRQDSTTSSAPPSSDKPWDKEARRKERNRRKAEKKKSKGGAKKGHKGSRRTAVTPDEVERYEPTQCEECGYRLSSEAGRPAGRRQVTELSPLQPRVTEHRVYSKGCRVCGHRTRAGFPRQVVALGAFGPRLRALMAALRGAYGLSLRKSRQFLREVFGVRVSHGALSENEARFGRLLKGNYDMVDDWLSRAPRLFVDETSWFVRSVLWWLWVKSDGKTRCYKIQARRDTQAAMTFLGNFAGLLTTDELASYNGYDERKRQLCVGHLHRRIAGLALHPAMAEWAEKVDKAFEAMFVVWHRIRDGTEDFDDRRVLMDAPQRELTELFEQGKNHEHKRVRGLCTRALGKWKMWWRFVVVGSEPTNNEAERALRPAVIFRKLSHGSRSERGSRFFERMMTVVETLRGHGHDVFDFLSRTVARAARGQTLPLLPLGG